ncbi:low-specificity L-threonine aldolase [Streptomyces sp. NPDC089799]|uniref:low-specificity L-threonine aldolase n=1 Tax=Streptomyces sp. NPDC089799 TaxID=3155066 RepID=UPI00343C8BEB
MIELRSDTFTLPTAEMRLAMEQAELGDDVYGEDPTVLALEALAAKVTGMAAACLMPSGTMANLAAIMAHSPRGSKVLVGAESDIYVYEAGGATVCGGVVYEPIPNQPDGTLSLEDLAKAFPDDMEDPQFALPSLICLENTQNRCGGSILPQEYLARVADFAAARGVAVHMDGARLFNAAVGADVPVADITQYADSVQFCLSKGLSAPIGSILAGDADFIVRARRIRKMLGGGMRQAGFIAAAGIVAIESASRLSQDHALARRLARGLAEIDGIDVQPDSVQTNIVMFRVGEDRFTWQEFVDACKLRGLAVAELGHGRIRAVTHAGVEEQDIEDALEIVRELLSA